MLTVHSIHQNDKICSQCGLTKPLSEFYTKIKKTGRLFSWCRSCHWLRTERYRRSHMKEYAETAHRWKLENPEKWKLSRERTLKKNVVKIKLREQAYRRRIRQTSEFKAKKRIWSADYRARKQDQIKASTARYYSENREKIKERLRKWREAHPEEYLQIHGGWKKRNVSACRAMAHRRYAKVKAGGSWTAAEWEAIKRAQDFTCLMCHRREPEIILTVDHVIPISENGPNVASNLQGLCKSCNSKKHRKVLDLRNMEQSS